MDKEYIMKKNIGLWIDHREAVIVELTDKGEQITRIKSDAEKQIRFAGGSRKDGLQTTEAVRGKKLDTHLDKYFDEIVAHIRDADSIQIFGPGDAKNKLSKQLEKDGLKERTLEIETMDNMTDNQIAAKVRERFSTQGVV
jgi:stalled ribosome rescue protein Dom34